MQTESHIQQIFAAALEKQPGAEREEYLTVACRGEPNLRQQVESLLRAHERAGNFLGPTIKFELPDSGIEHVGTRIGRYKLLEQIGEGGFGVVYMAEQTEPVQRKVALKIIKAGMDTRQVVVRFEAERQALALMDHPNIARVLDAGATEAGRPYFVMELVRGMPITDYCDRSNLPTRERLQLFRTVCQAVQHAHQKGIIHRDIKPSNVLVTLHDGEPVPKVIDFGIAKALGQKLTEKTLFTGFAHLIGTPAYMSPEQAELSGLDIDTRADIYSLGVLLYELLTGETPFDKDTLRRAALDEIRRMIRETEPPRPSTRLQTLGEKITDVAKRRHTEPAALSRLVRGDLDWITMKCLEKDRRRRYETANGLARDIQRHLNHEPVTACPPSNLYRLQKLVHRNKLAFAAASMVLAALVIGLGVSTWSLVREKEARQFAEAARKEQERLRQAADTDRKKAETEASKSRQVSHFLEDMLESVGPSVALGRDATMLREILDNTAKRIGGELKDQPEVEAQLRNTTGVTYYELGDWPKAEAAHREALRLRKELFGETNEFVASSLHNLGNVLCGESKFAEAESVQRAALAIRRNLLGNKHPDVVRSLAGLAGALGEQGKVAEAGAALREALAIQRELPGPKFPALADLLNEFVSQLMGERKWPEAESKSREAVALGREFAGDGHPTLATSLVRLARVLEETGRPAEAEPFGREAVAMRRKLLGDEHPYVDSALDRLASILGGAGKPAEATALLRECLAIRDKRGSDDAGRFTIRVRLGEDLLEQKEYAEAETLLLTAYRGMKQKEERLAAGRKPYLPRAVRALVRLYEETNRPDKAAEWRQKLGKSD